VLIYHKALEPPSAGDGAIISAIKVEICYRDLTLPLCTGDTAPLHFVCQTTLQDGSVDGCPQRSDLPRPQEQSPVD
jgi:hypothetical protein